MKMKTLLFAFASLLISTALLAQDPIVIPGGADNGGKLETTINGDTTATGERNNPNQVYELEAGTFYLQHAAININNPDGTLTIRGQEGATKPVILKQPLNEVAVGSNQIQSSLVLQNVQYHNMATDGVLPWALFSINGDNHTLVVEDVLMEHSNGILFNMNNVKAGCAIQIRNSYFRDMQNGSGSQWWSGRVIQCKVPVDNFIFENNTITGSGLTILGQQCLFEYAEINHNTFINGRKYPALNQYWKEVYFTNNLFVNSNWVGEDKENVATGGQDPDGLLHGISGVDTVTTSVWMNPKFLTEDSTLTSEIDEISDYIYYAADNVAVSSASLDNYYGGGLSPDWDDAPSSYLDWGGMGTGPWKVVSVPGIWANERTTAMVADWDNLKDENNSIYEYTTEELGFGTEPLTQAGADILAVWNQAKWAVPDMAAPTEGWEDNVHFGDYDPNTIPGIETEDGSGISKISDLLEDFSYTMDLKSKSDGLRIGALHWNDEVFDAAASMAAVKAAYAYTGIEENVVSLSELELRNYPNPFTGTTTIAYKMTKDSHVNLSVYDVSGRIVETLVDEARTAGEHTVQFTPEFSSSSTYFIKITTDYHTSTRKMMMLK